MKLLSFVGAAGNELDLVEGRYPYLFLRAYHEFERRSGQEPALLLGDAGAIAPVRLRRRFGVRFAQFLYPPLRDGCRLGEAAEQGFLDEAVSFLRESGCARISAPFILDVFRATPRGAVACPFGSYSVDLDRGLDQIFQRFQQRYRSAIGAARKAGTVVKSGSDRLGDFHRLYGETMVREAKSVEPFGHFAAMFQCLSEAHLLCAVAYHEGEAQAAAWVPFTRSAGYYLYGGSARRTASSGIGKLLHFDVMKRLQSVGVRRYVLGGARLSDVSGTKWEGIQHFKERFGSDLTRGFLWKMDLEPFRCGLYDIGLRLRHGGWGGRSPLDLIDEERARLEGMRGR